MSDIKFEVETMEPVPDWLTQALEISSGFHLFTQEANTIEGAPPDFHTRCSEAAGVAYTVARFSRQAQSVGFIAVSFAEYLSGLAKLTKCPLDPLLKRFGIARMDQVDLNSIRGLASVWRELGFGLREALATLRLSLLPRDSGIQLLLARQRAARGGSALLEQCESLLNDIEAGIGCEYFEQLRSLEGELLAQYKSGFENGQI